MYELALFAGAGGGMLGGILLGWRTVCAVEINGYCREVLLRRQRDGMLPVFPIWDDVRTFGIKRKGSGHFVKALRSLAADSDVVVSAGFPCQPFAICGNRKGELDEKNLWPETIRIIREVGPRFAFLENVPGLIYFNYFGQILGDLGESGYDAEWDIVSAWEVGAPQIRKRLWVFCWKRDALDVEDGVGNAGSDGESPPMENGRGNEEKQVGGAFTDTSGVWKKEKENGITFVNECGRREVNGCFAEFNWWRFDPADANDSSAKLSTELEREQCIRRWGIESGLGRVVDGMANRVDRVKALGNGQVPLVAATAFVRLAARAGFDVVRWLRHPEERLKFGACKYGEAKMM